MGSHESQPFFFCARFRALRCNSFFSRFNTFALGTDITVRNTRSKLLN